MSPVALAVCSDGPVNITLLVTLLCSMFSAPMPECSPTRTRSPLNTRMEPAWLPADGDGVAVTAAAVVKNPGLAGMPSTALLLAVSIFHAPDSSWMKDVPGEVDPRVLICAHEGVEEQRGGKGEGRQLSF